MYSGIQCLYSLSSVVEIFPPKSKRDFIGDCLVALPRFVSLTCGTVSAAPHNSYKLLLALSELSATPRVLVRLIRMDKSFEMFQTTAQSLARLGISKLLFLRGGYYVGRQLGLDLISSFRILKMVRCLSLFCVNTNRHKTHSLSANTRLD